MAYEFKKYSEVELLSEVPGNATVLAEVDGALKRVPSDGLGGGSGGSDEPDLVLRVINSDLSAANSDDVSILSGSLSNVASVISNNRAPSVVLSLNYYLGSGDLIHSSVSANVVAHMPATSYNSWTENYYMEFSYVDGIGSVGSVGTIILKFDSDSCYYCSAM